MNTTNDAVLKLKEIFDFLRSYGDVPNLNQFVDDDVLSLPDELSEQGENMIDILDDLLKNCDNNDFLNDVFNEDEQIFSDWISSYVDFRREILGEIAYINELEFADFCTLIEYVFKTHILVYNDIETFDNYNENQIKIAIKAINTFIKMIICEMFSQKVFTRILRKNFNLQERKIEFLWDIIKENKNELRYISLIRLLDGQK